MKRLKEVWVVRLRWKHNRGDACGEWFASRSSAERYAREYRDTLTIAEIEVRRFVPPCPACPGGEECGL